MSGYQKVSFAPIDGANFGANRPRKKILTEAEVALQRAEAFKEGEAASQATAERQTAESLRSIAHMMQMILGRVAAEAEQLRQDAIDLALASAKAISGAAINANNEAQVSAYLKEALSSLCDSPRLVVKVPSQSIDLLKDKLMATAEEAGFGGKLDIRGDDEARLGDCSIEWQNGAIRYEKEEIIEKIEALAKDWLLQASAETPAMDIFEP